MISESQFYTISKVPSSYARWWRRFKTNKLALFALVIYILIACLALFADIIAPFDPTVQFTDSVHLPPAWYENGEIRFLLGTDYVGRDMFSRLVHGARLTLMLSSIVVFLSASIGILLGVITSFAIPLLDGLILRIMDFILAIPSLLLAIVIVAIIGPGLPNAIYAVALVIVPHFVLVTRTAIKAEITKEYVLAAYLDGASNFGLFTRSILPNILPPIVIQVTLAFSAAILEIAALGFLGLGAQAPHPEWGTILSESHDNIIFAPWTVTLPGLAIFFTLLSVNLIGDGLRDAMDTPQK